MKTNRKKLFLLILITFSFCKQQKKTIFALELVFTETLGKPNDAAVAPDAETSQHQHQHSVEAASCKQSGQFDDFHFITTPLYFHAVATRTDEEKFPLLDKKFACES